MRLAVSGITKDIFSPEFAIIFSNILQFLCFVIFYLI